MLSSTCSSIAMKKKKNSSSSTLAVKKSARPKKKKSSAALRARKRQPDVDVEYVGTINGDDGKPNTRLRNQIREQKAHQQEQERNKEVKLEKIPQIWPRLEKGFTECPVCKMKKLVVSGCKTVTCTRTDSHPDGRYAYYCGYCQMLSERGDPPKCKCRYSFDKPTRLEVAANPELRTIDLDAFLESLEYSQVNPGEDGDDTSRASTGSSSSASEKMGDGKDSNTTDSDTSTKTTSEAVAMASASDEDNYVQDEVPTAVLSDRTIKIKRDPDAVPSTAFEEETIGIEISPQVDMSSTAIPVVVKVKTEGANSNAAHHEEKDVEDLASSKEDGGREENDVASPISQDSQHRKREAAAAEEQERRKAARKKRRKVSSARKTASKGRRKSSEDEEESAPTAKVVIDISDVPPQSPILKSKGNIKEGSSQYTGVYFIKATNKWKAEIKIEGKNCYIGTYENEEEAAINYARAFFKYKGQRSLDGAREQQNSAVAIDLSDVPPQPPIPKSKGYISEGASKYAGVSFHKASNKWHAMISIEGKQRYIGSYENEEEAAIDYARAVFKYKESLEDEEKSAPTAKVVIDLSDVPPQPPIFKRKGNFKEGASRYTGVHFNKANNKWQANITIEGKPCYIGSYENEEEAAVDYARAVFKYKGQDALDEAREQQNSASALDLSDVPSQAPILKREGNFKEGASRYKGISFNKRDKKWRAMIKVEGKNCYIGSYENEEQAAIDYARAVFKYKGQGALDRARARARKK